MKKRFFVGFSLASLILLVCFFNNFFYGDVYDATIRWLQAEAPGGNYAREIGTNKDLWLNGYLGLFFRFKMFGAINWLAFPLAFWFLCTVRKRERWEIALFLVLSMSCVFLCIKGFKNYRYQFTLVPPLISLMSLFGWEILGKLNKKVMISIIMAVGCLILVNGYTLLESYEYYWRAGVGDRVAGEDFPYKLVAFLNEKMANNSLILECNQPLLYYYTSKRGLSYSDKRMNRVYAAIGKNPYEALRMLRDNVGITHILTRDPFGRRLNNIINVGCKLICDDQGYKLYEVENSFNSVKDYDSTKSDFETDFSNWAGEDEVSMVGISKAIPPMTILGGQGFFIFKRVSSDVGPIVRVMLRDGEFNKKSAIQFGYRYNVNGLNLKVKENDLVGIAARVRLSQNVKREPQIFVQDKTDYWSREKIQWHGTSWQDIFVSRKVRDGFTDICMGIYWEPASTDEWLDIQSMRIYVNKAGECE